MMDSLSPVTLAKMDLMSGEVLKDVIELLPKEIAEKLWKR